MKSSVHRFCEESPTDRNQAEAHNSEEFLGLLLPWIPRPSLRQQASIRTFLQKENSIDIDADRIFAKSDPQNFQKFGFPLGSYI